MQPPATATRPRAAPATEAEATVLRVHRPGPLGEAPGVAKILWKALRPHQWAKNLLLFLPMFFAHQLGNLSHWLGLGLAFAIFSMCASAVYLFNDILDIDADRRHPTKQHRPLAAGWMKVWQAAALAAGLLAMALGCSVALMSWSFTGVLLLYVASTTGYTLYFKRTLFLDIIVLAGLYTLRLLAGGVVVDVEISQWLRAFSMFFFISLALVKRYVELRTASQSGQLENNRRGYVAGDEEMIQIVGLVSGFVSVVVFCLYLSSSTVERIYPHNSVLWLIAPALLYWITRIWLLARRSVLSDDPVVAALTDRNSYLVGLTCAGLVLLASL